LILYVVKQSIKTRTISNLFFLFSFLLAVFIQSYQQTCLMNWSYLFEQWVHNQQFTPTQVAWYELMYQLVYLLTPILLLITYTLVINAKWLASFKPRLIRAGLLISSVLALLLVLYPFALSTLFLSVIVLIGLIIAVILNKRILNG
jgi:hypothetical protein